MNSTRPGATLDFCKVSPSSRRGSDQDVRQANCAFDVFAVEPDIERRGSCADAGHGTNDARAVPAGRDAPDPQVDRTAGGAHQTARSGKERARGKADTNYR